MSTSSLTTEPVTDLVFTPHADQNYWTLRGDAVMHGTPLMLSAYMGTVDPIDTEHAILCALRDTSEQMRLLLEHTADARDHRLEFHSQASPYRPHHRVPRGHTQNTFVFRAFSHEAPPPGTAQPPHAFLLEHQHREEGTLKALDLCARGLRCALDAWLEEIRQKKTSVGTYSSIPVQPMPRA